MQSQAVITPGSVEREGIKLTQQPILASPPPTSMPHSVPSCHYPHPSAQPSLAPHGSLRFYIVSQTHLPPSLFWPLPGWRLQPRLTHPIACGRYYSPSHSAGEGTEVQGAYVPCLRLHGCSWKTLWDAHFSLLAKAVKNSSELFNQRTRKRGLGLCFSHFQTPWEAGVGEGAVGC